MIVQDLIALLEAKPLSPDFDLSAEVKHGIACDLLSWVMTRGCENAAWVTVMSHMNVVAVAALLDLACVILPEGVTVDEPVLAKAVEEGIPLLSTQLTSFEVAGRLYEKGVTKATRG